MEGASIRYVVGIDGSAESREALRWASRLATVLGGEIVAVHAQGLLERPGSGHRAGVEIFASVREIVTPIRVVVRDGSPLDVLPAVAAEEAATLLIVGSRGTGSAPALALGSTSLHLLQTSTVPVLVIPTSEQSRAHLALRRVLVAVDGAGHRDRPMHLVAWLAAGFGSQVEVVHAVEDVPVFPQGPSTAARMAGEPDAPERARSLLEPARRMLERSGLSTHIRVERGQPTEVVRVAAATTDADLVVLASGHVGEQAGSLLRNSVSRQVASVVHRPVLVVPVFPDARRSPEPADVMAGASA